MSKTAQRARALRSLQRKAAALTPAKAAPAIPVKVADEGIVVAIVSVTGVVDAVNDLIVPGVYAASLAARRPKVVDDHEWQHKVGRVLHAEEWLPGDPRLPKRTKDGRPWPKDAGALVATMQYNLNTERGRESFAMVKFYAESNEAEFSIGYKVPEGKARIRRDGVRVIFGMNLFEFSHVLFGAAPLSMALEVKSLHAGTVGQTAAPSLTPSKRTSEPADEEDKPYPTAPKVKTDAPWDGDEAEGLEEKRREHGTECKTAAQVVLEAKVAAGGEVKSTDREVKAMGQMKGSYEERRNLLEAAARDLFEATYADPCVCLVATYETEAVCTVYDRGGDQHSFLVPYTYSEDGVELGEPSSVELSLVAEPAGDSPIVEAATEDVEDVAVIAPTLDALEAAAALAATEGKAAAAVRAAVADLFGVETKTAEEEPQPATPEVVEGAVEATPDTITADTLPDGEWATYRKTEPIEAVRMEEDFTVQTREGVVAGKAGDWLAIDSEGYPYPIDAEEFEAVYEPDDAPTPTVDQEPDPEADLDPDQAPDEVAQGPEDLETKTPAEEEDRVTLDPDEVFSELESLEPDSGLEDDEQVLAPAA